MSVQIELPPEWEPIVRREAARRGIDTNRFVNDLFKRDLIANELTSLKDRQPPKSIADLEPQIAPKSGTSWVNSVIGRWPGEESDEQFERMVEELS